MPKWSFLNLEMCSVPNRRPPILYHRIVVRPCARPVCEGKPQMAIRAYLEDAAAFDDQATAAMSKAFMEACNALQIFNGDERGREAVAVRIIELARSGVIDSAALRERVLLETKALRSL